MLACGKGHLEMVQTLFEVTGGEGLEERDKDGWTALYHAAAWNHMGVLMFLLSKGAVANLVDAQQETPLMVASRNGHLEVVQKLVEHSQGQGLEARNGWGHTALGYAVEQGHREVARFLLSRGTWAGLRETQGVVDFLLMLASGENLLEVARPLLRDVGPKGLNKRDGEGRTALWLAVSQGSWKGHSGAMIKVLLLAGADPHIGDNEGRTPHQLAQMGGYSGCVEAFEVRDYRPRETGFPV